MNGFHLLAAGVLLAIALGWGVRRIEAHAMRIALKPREPVDDLHIHTVIRYPASFSQPAKKGAKAGLMQPTRDDAVVERKHLENLVRLGDRRVH